MVGGFVVSKQSACEIEKVAPHVELHLLQVVSKA